MHYDAGSALSKFMSKCYTCLLPLNKQKGTKKYYLGKSY
jgi:hypothetical protein